MPFKKLKVRIRFMLLSVIVVVSLMGCASAGSFTPSGTPITDMRESLGKGEIRLMCDTSCAGSWGSNRHEMKQLYSRGLWYDLARKVTNLGFHSDLAYYYLGRAAEGLEYNEAARTYYKLAKTSSYKCDGWINNCDGLVFPRDIDTRLDPLDKFAAVMAEAVKFAAVMVEAEKIAAVMVEPEKITAEDAARRISSKTEAKEKSAEEKVQFEGVATVGKPATNVQADDPVKFCRHLSYLAENIMNGRQNNIDLDVAYKNILEQTTDAPSEIQDIVKRMVVIAYEVPQCQSMDEENIVVCQYRDIWFKECLKWDIGNAILPTIHTPKVDHTGSRRRYAYHARQEGKRDQLQRQKEQQQRYLRQRYLRQRYHY